MIIKKIHLENCLCFKDATIPPKGEFGQINCFIGRNDRGKSLILKILDMLLKGINSAFLRGISGSGSLYDFEMNPAGLNLIYLSQPGTAKIYLYVKKKDSIFTTLKEIVSRLLNSQGSTFAKLAMQNIETEEIMKIEYIIDFKDESSGRFYINSMSLGELQINCKPIGLQIGDDIVTVGRLDEVNKKLTDFLSETNFTLIPANRRVSMENREGVVDKDWNPNLNGTGIPNAFFEFTNRPELGKRRLIRRIQQKVRQFSEVSTTTAIGNRNFVELEYDGINHKFVGDGTKQITVSLFDIDYFTSEIIGYEEPENQLHPERQKRLIKFIIELAEERDLQFFLTTHSPFIIDQLNLENVYHFTKTDDGVQVNNVETDEGIWELLKEIGVKPHDFLQSDMILFTEGPSDRLLLEIFANTLGYNLDQLNTTMFDVGGSYPNLDLDALLKINRNFRLILCSHTSIPESVKDIQRIKERFEEAGLTSKLIILKKREIENYLSNRVIEKIFNFNKGSIIIDDDTNVINLVKETENKNGQRRGWGIKTHTGPKVAREMEINEIDSEIKKVFTGIIEELKKD